MQKRFPLPDVIGVGIDRTRRWCKAHPQRAAWSVLAPLALGLLLLCAPAVLAAVQLNYFTVIPGPSSVVLEWSTATEVNVAGFDVQCKLANEPDSAFHEIGYVRAKGGPDVGALYSFPVSNLVPGTAYCFRLKEITTDGSPGEVFDRCGYGPGVTPTPGVPGSFPTFTPAPIVVPTDAFGNPILPTPVAVAPQPQPVATDAFGNPIPTPIPQPQAVATDAFGNPIPTPFSQPGAPTPPFVSPLPQPAATDAFGNPIPTPIPQPTAIATDAFGNPIATPIPQPTAIPTDAFGNPIPTPIPQPTAIATDAFGNPIPTPLPTAIPTDAFGNPIATPIPTPTVRVAESGAVDAFGSPLAAPANAGTGMTDAYGNPLPADASQAMAAPVDPNVQQQQYAQVATPTTEYVVVTATPTPAPVALAPVLTPLPTVTPPAPGMQLADTLAPTTQNLMVMLLCLTFTGASGIGILGLITSVMYMRARSSQREFFDRASTRRRL